LNAVTPNIDSLLAVVTATVDESGTLLAANAGFLRLIGLPELPAVAPRADQYFLQPDFATLLRLQPDKQGMLHQGLLTIGEYAGQTRSLRATVWRDGSCLRVLAEFDIDDLERLTATVLDLNRDYSQAQTELALANLKLQQREVQLRQTVADLQAANVRLKETQARLVEVEKMAALGVMVAGVAHEINTPVGVCLAAASTLGEQSQQLSRAFAQRSMTQSDLQKYLETAEAGTDLIHSNLARVGRLIDAFREVAVVGRPAEKKPFRFKACIDDVASSLGSRLSANCVALQIDCGPDLEVVSVAGDWASIFTNLMGNSLAHGFKGRDRGLIRIGASIHDGNLLVEYADDGVGLAPEVQTRIFDPFFTTDMQQGMGLGMHLVHNLITHRLGGTIACESIPGQGVRFEIWVPV
jgi:signal transduction histidine kinase